MRTRLALASCLVAVAVVLASCSPAPATSPGVATSAPVVVTQPAQGPPQTQVVTATRPAAPQPSTAPAGATTAPQPTTAPVTPAATATPAGATAVATASPAASAAAVQHVVELEWPPRMRLGDSGLVRLALIPSKDGYVVTTEFPEHRTVTTTVPVVRPGGYDLAAVARLDGAGFDFAPQGEQVQSLPPDSAATWRWTVLPRAAGQQGLLVSLVLRWTPQPGNPSAVHETTVYSKGLQVNVTSFLGLTMREATTTGVLGLLLGGSLSLPLALYVLRPRVRRSRLERAAPSESLRVEGLPASQLRAEESALLRALFRRYARVTIEAEFRSGYSGARTFLVLPVRADGRADAYTIAKLGERGAIEREYENYQAFVKDTLPPITARIQEAPVITPAPGGDLAVLRYTFIGEPGHTPTSLRQALLADPDPAWLEKLFDTFGPNWWLQRKPYTFRLAQEYDRMLPAHYVVEPVESGRQASAVSASSLLSGRAAPDQLHCGAGDLVRLRDFARVEKRPDGKWLALSGAAPAGQAPLRVRWLGAAPHGEVLGRVVATRETLLRAAVAGVDLGGAPDPIDCLPSVLAERVMGTQSTIHGDLNLENILIGPGGFVWLIDFAQTRDGHPLFDFAHLEAEIIAQVIAPGMGSPQYRALLQGAGHPLLNTLHAVAARCLFNPSQRREYALARYCACLGALKFANLDAHARELLYLSAAHAL